MAETQREPVPRADSGELDVALAFLSFARHCVLKKVGGLSDEQLRRVLTGSGTSVLGLVQHLAEAERYWFGHHLAGGAWDPGREHGMTVPATRAPADVLRDYQAAIQDSDRAIRAAGDPDARFAVPVDGNRHTLRWVITHMTSETARHAATALPRSRPPRIITAADPPCRTTSGCAPIEPNRVRQRSSTRYRR
jgi:uncharacterized damage-inducible protein DinB